MLVTVAKHVAKTLLKLFSFVNSSLKEKQHLEVAKSVPLNRLLLGTSSPRCSVQRPHAGMKLLTTGFFSKSNRLSQDMVVGRTEPSHMW